MVKLWIENPYYYKVKILFGTASFLRNMKRARKSICVAIKNSTILKNKTKQKI